MYDSQVEHAKSWHSILSIMGERSSIFGFVVLMGKPRYVNGMESISHPKVFTGLVILSYGTLIEYICDFL
jgi:hypothetical protein